MWRGRGAWFEREGLLDERILLAMCAWWGEKRSECYGNGMRV